MLTLNDGRSELWQWDTGRTLAVDAECSQVHFSNKVFGRSIDVDVIEGAAIIPDILLQTDRDLNVWAFVGTAENGYTKISKTFKVNRRNKPADYVFTPPEQTSLEEIKEKIDYLESIQDPDAIKNAVNDYLEQNPVEAPVQSVNGQTGTVELNAEDVGAIAKTELPTAINTSLAQAKASGEFDGADGADGGYYTPAVTQTAENTMQVSFTPSKTTMPAVDGTEITLPAGPAGSKGEKGDKGDTGAAGAGGKSAYAYAVEGGYTGTEADFAAKLAAEKFANPNALTFTGGATGSYDGSAPVSVEIPSGGGSGSSENWRLVNTVTTAEDVSDIKITQDSDGNPLSLKKVKIFVKVRGNSANLSTWCRITVNNLTNNFYSDIQNTFAAKEGQDYYNYARADYAIYAGRLMLELLLRSANNAASKNTLWWVNNSGCFENYPDVVDAITSIRMWSASAGIGAGTELMIYGVDA